ncbi:hypothetical protein DB31_0452 [Hyalangium minutum]|uniref:Uncharacterized protein n=1 Tax=Hyalangium minutum TaxID=394096 RepID=A0A085WWX8_9BACT|nr:hypothetical protein DB31_0452 [Hyalangium minutum]
MCEGRRPNSEAHDQHRSENEQVPHSGADPNKERWGSASKSHAVPLPRLRRCNPS